MKKAKKMIEDIAEGQDAQTLDAVQGGDQLQVKVVEIDDKGRINLSHKAVL